MFEELPPLAIGTIWEYNNHYYNKTPVVDADAIVPAEDETHPALDPSNNRRLRYRPNDHGAVRVLPREQMRNTWWERGGACVVAALSEWLAEQVVASTEALGAAPQQLGSSAGPADEEAESTPFEEPEVEDAEVEEPEPEEPEEDELEEESGPSMTLRGRKRARSLHSDSSGSEGHSRVRRRP